MEVDRQEEEWSLAARRRSGGSPPGGGVEGRLTARRGWKGAVRVYRR